jgi:hypothetical protein
VSTEVALDPAKSDSGGGRVFARAVQKATSDVKGISGLFLALGTATASYIALRKSVAAPEYLPEAIVALVLMAFYFLYVHPEWREERKRYRLSVDGIRGQIVDPTYFRLTPYQADDKDHFTRPDDAVKAAIKWITGASVPLLYLSGQSGVGKSSLVNAAIVPSLTDAGWVVVTVRPHDSALVAIAGSVGRTSAIWETPPGSTGDLRELLERSADIVRHKSKRLLIIVDQFEEALILGDEPAKSALGSFLRSIVEKPITGLTVLLCLRAEYLNDVVDLGLPIPNFAENAFEIRPFTRAAAQAFIEASKIDPGAGLLDKVLNEAAEIEDMPDRVRPIVINMFGLVIASFKGSLPKGIEPGRLLSGYVERSLNAPGVREIAVAILRPLVTDVGTKRTLYIDQIAQAAGVEVTIARGCLIRLANDGLVRPLDKASQRWEVAHDFIARLLQPSLRNWRKSTWEKARPWIAPVSLSIWLVAAVAAIILLPTLRDMVFLGELQAVGLVPGAYDEQGRATFTHTGDPIKDLARLWRTSHKLNELSYPVAGLTIRHHDLTSLQGMPMFPALAELELSQAELTSLQGMPAFPSLAILELAGTQLTTLQGMPVLSALTTLNLQNDPLLKSLRGMPTLPALKLLNLSGLRLTSLQELPALPTLVTLNITNVDSLESLKGMPTFPALATLNLELSWGLRSLEGLPALPALAKLDLSAMRLTSLRGIPELPALAMLNLARDTNLTSLQGMPTFPALATLDLSDAGLTSLQGMPTLPALATLDLSDTKLTSLQGMPVLPALTSLDLSQTELTSLQGMPELPRLEIIDIRGLKLNGFDELKSLPKLRTIFASPVQLEAIPMELRPKVQNISP